MRYMLTLAAIHDDDHDPAAIADAADAVWGEVYLADGTPVEFVTAGAIVLTEVEVMDLVCTLNTAPRTNLSPRDRMIDRVRDTLHAARVACQARA